MVAEEGREPGFFFFIVRMEWLGRWGMDIRGWREEKGIGEREREGGMKGLETNQGWSSISKRCRRGKGSCIYLMLSFFERDREGRGERLDGGRWRRGGLKVREYVESVNDFFQNSI